MGLWSHTNPLRVGIAAVAVFGAIASHANEPLDADQQSLFPGLENARTALGLPAELEGTGERTFKVLEIQNIRGNDPFNEQQPLLNFNGQIVASVADLLALIQGQQNIGGGGDGNVCDPNVQTSGVFVANIFNFNFFEDLADGSINFDAGSGQCRLEQGTNGDVAFFTYPVRSLVTQREDLGADFFDFDAIQIDGPIISAGDAGAFNAFRLGRRVLRVRDPETNRVFDFDIEFTRIAGRSEVIDAVDGLGNPRRVQAIVETPVFTFTVFSITEVGG